LSTDIGREWRAAFSRWPIAVLGLTILPGLAGAILVPDEGASSGERLGVALIAALAALSLLAFIALVVALIRVPISEYREHHLRAKLGQECVDCAREVLQAIQFKSAAITPPDGEAPPLNRDRPTKLSEEILGMSDLEVSQIAARYERYCAARVYRCATALHEGDHIDREERDTLRLASVGPTAARMDGNRQENVLEILKVTQTLIRCGVRLGGQVYKGSRGDWDRPPSFPS
jgi:hypothetical protein